MQPQAPYSPAPNSLPQGYEFMNAPAPQKRSFNGPSSMVMRVVVVAGGLLMLLVLFVIVKGILSGGGNGPLLLSVIQDQQELVHLSANAQQQNPLSDTNTDVAITTQAAVGSAQAQLASYIKLTGGKLDAKKVSFKVSTATDASLTNAATVNNYDTVFKNVMQQKLAVYKSDLKAAYAKTKGSNGKKLLSQDYSSANLLFTQLDASN